MNDQATINVLYQAALDSCRPHVVMRPAVVPDGDKWVAMYGVNLQESVSGYGDTPEDACRDFDRIWLWGNKKSGEIAISKVSEEAKNRNKP